MQGMKIANDNSVGVKEFIGKTLGAQIPAGSAEVGVNPDLEIVPPTAKPDVVFVHNTGDIFVELYLTKAGGATERWGKLNAGQYAAVEIFDGSGLSARKTTEGAGFLAWASFELQ